MDQGVAEAFHSLGDFAPVVARFVLQGTINSLQCRVDCVEARAQRRFCASVQRQDDDGCQQQHARDREQTSIAYNASAPMIRADAAMSKIVRIVDSQKLVIHEKSDSRYKAGAAG